MPTQSRSPRPRPITPASAPKPRTPPKAAPVSDASLPVSPRVPRTDASWTFLSNHAHVLICISEDPEVRMRDLASRVGITERAVQRIVTELKDGGYLELQKEGRRNHYRVTASRPLRHPIERHCATDALIDLVLGRSPR